MTLDDVLVVIINHQLNTPAIEMKQGFAPLVETLLFDSGSDLSESEKVFFDQINPNIFYSGLFNQAVEVISQKKQKKILLFIASDVGVSNYTYFCQRMLHAFQTRSDIGVYAPASFGSNHPQMWPRSAGQNHPVVFADGFCFASRVELLSQVAPVDLKVNQLGWGIDVYLAYIAMKNQLLSVVDSQNIVSHPVESGYSSKIAREQRDTWLLTLPRSFRNFQKLSGMSFFKTALGYPFFKLFRAFT